MLPNFFIAGAPKSGTTTLYRYLNEHRDVFMSPIKEPNFFSYDQIVEQNLYYPDKGVGSRDAYENLFKKVTKEKAIGEASVSYFFYDQVPSKIRSSIPDAKIILILRNPTARSFSHYLMDFRLGYVDTLFEDIVYKQIDCPLLDLYYQQFVELGFYYEHVKKYFDVFGEANVKVILNEDLKDHMRQVFIEVCDFLQIGSNVKQDFNREYNVYRNPRNSLVKFLYSVKTNRQIANAIIPTSLVDMIKDILLVRDKKPSLCQKTKSYLDLLFRENIYQTGELIGRNLSHWCDE